MAKKVLIVDDEPSIASLIADIAALLGFESRILNNGKEALLTAKKWKPDIITLDLMMPPPDGTEVLAQLKKDSDTKDIPVFIISVVANNREIAEKISSATKIFEKPVDTKQLVQQLKQIVNK